MITGGCRVKARIDSAERDGRGGWRDGGNGPAGGRNQVRPGRPGRGRSHLSSHPSTGAIGHAVRTSIVHVVAGGDKFARDPEEFAGRLAAQAVSAGDPTGWFERLYAAAEAGETAVPWDRGVPSPFLTQWAEQRGLAGARNLARSAATRAPAGVVGCGPGQGS